MEVKMNELINPAVKATALAQLVGGVKCAWPYILAGKEPPPECKAQLRFFFDLKYLIPYGVSELDDLIEIDPEHPPLPPNWPRPDPPPMDARMQMHEDALFILASILTDPGMGLDGLGALLRDPQLSLESAVRVQKALQNSSNLLAQEISRLEQLK
jgi:hypothetical protein